MAQPEPLYQIAHRSGRLQACTQEALSRLEACTLCPRRCKVDRRQASAEGFCRTGRFAWVASADAHFGEEAPLVGQRGSGTIFFSRCNLLCSFCQNETISHGEAGRQLSDEELARVMLALQAEGCHNINLVTPSHVVPQILCALSIAASEGLRIPLVFNTSAYDRVDTLKLLDGIVDIYMPDFKFWDPLVAERTCSAPDYPAVARRAVVEMHRQVGDLRIDDATGLACRGLLVRHLVMPGGLAGTDAVMAFLADSVSAATYVNIMDQYRPCGRVVNDPELRRRPTADEYDDALHAARAAGITRLDRPRRVFRIT